MVIRYVREGQSVFTPCAGSGRHGFGKPSWSTPRVTRYCDHSNSVRYGLYPSGAVRLATCSRLTRRGHLALTTALMWDVLEDENTVPYGQCR